MNLTRALGAILLLVVSSVVVGACSSGSERDDAGLRVLTSMALIADLVEEVGGDRIDVQSLIPPSADPHSHRPSPSDARAIADADVLFTNGLLLEDASVIKMIEGNKKSGAAYVRLAESVTDAGGRLIDLEESVDLDVLWLGLAVDEYPTSTTQEAEIRLLSATGPGEFFLYQTDTFGNPQVFFDSTDGFDASDSTSLPFGSHTHLNWTFTAPGRYEIVLEGRIGGSQSAQTTLVFVVGQTPADKGRHVLDSGHADVLLSIKDGQPGGIFVRSDNEGTLSAEQAVLVVPDAARATVSDDKRFSFLGVRDVWVLPQAVIGRHVHGSTDPHIWLDPANARAYVRLIQQTLTTADPEGEQTYKQNAAAYLERLDAMEAAMEKTLSAIPSRRRILVTTHDAFGYLASRFDFEVVGFVVPSPGRQASAGEIARLRDSILDSNAPAVFVEPQLSSTSRVLTNLSSESGVKLCRLYSESFDDDVQSYEELMRFNANELARCLR